jgi:hypothetical protein
VSPERKAPASRGACAIHATTEPCHNAEPHRRDVHEITGEAAMGRFVIAAFKPRPGKEPALLAAIEKHWRILQGEGLVTDRPRYAMRAADGTMLEVFEWRSAEAIERAHANPAVHALWAEFEAACEYVPLGSLSEAGHPFSEFDPLDV